MTDEKVVEQATSVEEQVGEQASENVLEAAQAQAAEYLEQWRRVSAEFANYKKRKDKEVQDAVGSASGEVIKRLLPVLDDFDRAFKAIPAELQSHPWLEGFRLIERKFNLVLEQAGVERIETVGKPFDPNVHECAAVYECDEEEGTVLEEYRRGYRLNGKVLRPATVQVAKRKG